MPITFVPRRGIMLVCNFDMGRVAPEMTKKRRVLVVSPRSYNRGHRCVVVPFSATKPHTVQAPHVFFAAHSYKVLTKDVWAICECLTSVSCDRLDRVLHGGGYIAEEISAADLARVEAGMRHALGL